MLVQLSKPAADADGVLRYLALRGLGRLGTDSVSFCVDGDSMAPRIRQEDLLVCRRTIAPQPGQVAAVKVCGYKGQAVKVWRPEGDHVHLISINESYPPWRVLRADVVWAYQVLCVVRL